MRRAAPAATDSPPSIEPHRAARTLAVPIDLSDTHRRSVAGARTRSPFFCGDFLQDLDVHNALGQYLLEPSVLGLKLPQPLHIHRLKLPEALAPGIDRDIADPVLLGYFRHRRLVRLAQDLDHLFFRKPCLLHGPLGSRRTIVPKYQLYRKSTSRSPTFRSPRISTPSFRFISRLRMPSPAAESGSFKHI